MVFTGLSRTLHIIAGIFSLDNRYLAGKTTLLVRAMLVNCGHILSETGKSSDLGGNSHLKGLSGDSLYISALVDRTGTRVYL